MEYESNKVIDFIGKASVLEPVLSDTTKSIYFSWKNYSIRYSDHKTTSRKSGRFDVVYYYQPQGFLIREPYKEDWAWYSEDDAYTFFRRLDKKDRKHSKKDNRPMKRKIKVINQVVARVRKEEKHLKKKLHRLIEGED
jgi:spermidine/putrescine-binding protein